MGRWKVLLHMACRKERARGAQFGKQSGDESFRHLRDSRSPSPAFCVAIRHWRGERRVSGLTIVPLLDRTVDCGNNRGWEPKAKNLIYLQESRRNLCWKERREKSKSSSIPKIERKETCRLLWRFCMVFPHRRSADKEIVSRWVSVFLCNQVNFCNCSKL